MMRAFLPICCLALAACTQVPAPGVESSASNARSTESAARDPAAPASRVPANKVDAPNASPAQGNTPDASALARTDGYGELRLGMNEAQARAAWKGELKGDTVEPDNCAYLRPKADEEFRIGFMFERGVLVRYDVDIDSEAAPGRGRVGQTRADIERLYAGRVEARPHEYVAGGNYLRVTDPAIRDGALVFETDENGRVTRWRVGRAPQVDYVEGCS